MLYANVKYPGLKTDYPDWTTRARHISKLWRKTTPEERAPFLVALVVFCLFFLSPAPRANIDFVSQLKAKDNRSLLKTSRTRKSESSKTPTPPAPSETPESKLSAPGVSLVDLIFFVRAACFLQPNSEGVAVRAGHKAAVMLENEDANTNRFLIVTSQRRCF